MKQNIAKTLRKAIGLDPVKNETSYFYTDPENPMAGVILMKFGNRFLYQEAPELELIDAAEIRISELPGARCKVVS